MLFETQTTAPAWSRSPPEFVSGPPLMRVGDQLGGRPERAEGQHGGRGRWNSHRSWLWRRSIRPDRPRSGQPAKLPRSPERPRTARSQTRPAARTSEPSRPRRRSPSARDSAITRTSFRLRVGHRSGQVLFSHPRFRRRIPAPAFRGRASRGHPKGMMLATCRFIHVPELPFGGVGNSGMALAVPTATRIVLEQLDHGVRPSRLTSSSGSWWRG
jgi:hypothetical protein